MSESDSLSQKQKKATFGVVFLTIFMDMVGFSVIFPLFPSMLDHYLSREAAMGGGLVTNFVEMVKGYAFEGAEVVTSVQQALAQVEDVEEIMVIGGGHIYEQFLPLASSLYLTFIDLQVEGDTRFPDYEQVGRWRCVERVSHSKDATNPHNYEFVTLNKEV